MRRSSPTSTCRAWTATSLRAASAPPRQRAWPDAAHADRRGHGQRHEGRGRALPRRRHGRLSGQAGEHGPAAHHARALDADRRTRRASRAHRRCAEARRRDRSRACSPPGSATMRRRSTRCWPSSATPRSRPSARSRPRHAPATCRRWRRRRTSSRARRRRSARPASAAAAAALEQAGKAGDRTAAARALGPLAAELRRALAEIDVVHGGRDEAADGFASWFNPSAARTCSRRRARCGSRRDAPDRPRSCGAGA